MTAQAVHLHACMDCLFQSFSEFRLGLIIRIDQMDPVHLDHKSNRAMIPFTGCSCQLMQMFDAPLRRRIREQADTLLLVIRQCTSLDLRQIAVCSVLHVEIDAGIPVLIFRLYQIIKVHSFQILPHQNIGSQTVNIDPFQARLVDRDQVVGCLAIRVPCFLQRYFCLWKQQFPKTACFFLHE